MTLDPYHDKTTVADGKTDFGPPMNTLYYVGRSDRRAFDPHGWTGHPLPTTPRVLRRPGPLNRDLEASAYICLRRLCGLICGGWPSERLDSKHFQSGLSCGGADERSYPHPIRR
jgi:hypothetical protein